MNRALPEVRLDIATCPDADVVDSATGLTSTRRASSPDFSSTSYSACKYDGSRYTLILGRLFLSWHTPFQKALGAAKRVAPDNHDIRFAAAPEQFGRGAFRITEAFRCDFVMQLEDGTAIEAYAFTMGDQTPNCRLAEQFAGIFLPPA